MNNARKAQILEKLAKNTGHKGVEAPMLYSPESTKTEQLGKTRRAQLRRRAVGAQPAPAPASASATKVTKSLPAAAEASKKVKAVADAAGAEKKVLLGLSGKALGAGALGAAGLGLGGLAAYKHFKKK